jgi:hypothetical protein
MCLIEALSIYDTERYTVFAECHFSECYYAERYYVVIVYCSLKKHILLADYALKNIYNIDLLISSLVLRSWP